MTFALRTRGQMGSECQIHSTSRARAVTVVSMIRDGLDALLHPSARFDALTRARHHAFIAPRLLASLTALAAFPIYLAVRGVPTALEAVICGLLIAPIWLSWFLSRTGRYGGAEDRYRLLAMSMSDVILCHHRNGAVQFISPAAEAMLGAPVAQLLGHGLFDRVHVADRPAYLTALSEAARGEACSVEFRVRRDIACGRERGQGNSVDFIWVEMRCKPLEPVAEAASPSQAGVVAVLRDVSERKNQEQALDLARNAAEKADASRTRFLATMSHELRTPLNAIIGFSEMIIQEDALMLDAARRKEYAQLINDSGQHLLSVVNGILDMSKMESGNFDITPEPFPPRDALLNCCNLLALKARDNAIDLVTRTPDNLPVMNGDPRAFRQIALNLVSNAIKFTERGGTVTVSAAVEGSRLVLRVADNGVGIAADDLKRIGDPFFQAGKTYERRHEGTGLGLSIVKSLVALHGGEMTMRSRIGEGTTVTVALPLTFTPPVAPSSNVTTVSPLRTAISDRILQVKRSA